MNCEGKAAHLDFITNARAVHPTGHVDGVSPDVVLWLPGPYNARHHGANVNPNPDPEVIERVFVHFLEQFL